jgi:hypothetical protein
VQAVAGQRIKLAAASVTPPAGAWSVLATGGDAAPSTHPLTLHWDAAAGAWQGATEWALPVRPAAAATSTTQAAAPPVFELIETTTGPTPTRQSRGRLALTELPREAPRLRLKAGSIRHTPLNPTDGQTIYVTFGVENAGNAASLPAQPALLDRAPQEGGQTLPNLSGSFRPQIPVLGPDRATTITLRWDPRQNAGVQPIWISLVGEGLRSAPPDVLKEQAAEYRGLYVRTKTKLRRARAPWVTRSNEDIEAGRYKLHVAVANDGETDAHNVEVLYYRNEQRAESDLIGTELLKAVKAKSTQEAVLDASNLDPKKDHPVVTLRLKGSAQRIID